MALESVGFEARRMEKIFRLKPAAGQALPVMSVQESIENVSVRLEAVGPKILAHQCLGATEGLLYEWQGYLCIV